MSDPLVEAIFDLKVMLGKQENECDYKEKTYHHQYKLEGEGHCSAWHVRVQPFFFFSQQHLTYNK